MLLMAQSSFLVSVCESELNLFVWQTTMDDSTSGDQRAVQCVAGMDNHYKERKGEKKGKRRSVPKKIKGRKVEIGREGKWEEKGNGKGNGKGK